MRIGIAKNEKGFLPFFLLVPFIMNNGIPGVNMSMNIQLIQKINPKQVGGGESLMITILLQFQHQILLHDILGL